MKFLACLLFLFYPVKQEKLTNQYFISLTGELMKVSSTPKKVKEIEARELKKFEQTGDRKFFLSSRYSSTFFDLDDPVKQMPKVYELLRENNDEIRFISISCNYYFALMFEENSPQLASEFLEKALKMAVKEKSTFLPHIYHAKGRFYFNAKKYEQAKIFFEKSLNSLDRNDILYRASMYNNFGLVDEKLNNVSNAIRNTTQGIKILESLSKLNAAEQSFLIKMKCILGHYYNISGDQVRAEQLLNEGYNFYKSKKQYVGELLKVSENLVDIYRITGQFEKEYQLIDNLKKFSFDDANLEHQIAFYQILQNSLLQKEQNADLNLISKKLTQLNQSFDLENLEKNRKVSDLLNKTTIKIITNKQKADLNSAKIQKIWLSVIVVLLVFFCILIFTYLRRKIMLERQLAENAENLAESKRIILEQDVDIHKEKIKNLHQNLSLKIETEKAFLDNLKQLRNSRNINAEDIVKDLMFKVTNLLQIDARNFDLLSENSTDNNLFIKKISDRYPNLTKKELQLCLYFRMSLSSKEISILENTSSGTIRVYKTKIKGKMNLDRDVDLAEFLGKLNY